MGKVFDDPTTALGLLDALEKRLQRDLVGLVAAHGESKAVSDSIKTYEWLVTKRKALKA